MQQNKKTFTLIELLVVVAIIAILASMLLPALNKARSQAKMIKCSTQMKSLGQANFLYANDYDNWNVPQQDYRTSGDKLKQWWENKEFLNYASLLAEPSDARILLSKACPETEGRMRTLLNGVVTGYIWDNPPRTYAKSVWSQVPIDSNYNKEGIRAFKIGYLQAASKVGQWVDGQYNRGTAQYIHLDLQKHGGRALNVTFYDGHVSPESVLELEKQDALKQRIWGANGKSLGTLLKNGGK